VEGNLSALRVVYNTPTGILAWISIVLSILVIVTFLKERKCNRKLAGAPVQLLILAITDIAISLLWALGLVLRLLAKNNFLAESLIAYRTLFGYGLLAAGTNRSLLLYISFTRARIVCSLGKANQWLHKTEKDHIREVNSGIRGTMLKNNITS
jgi:hypothetical protein